MGRYGYVPYGGEHWGMGFGMVCVFIFFIFLLILGICIFRRVNHSDRLTGTIVRSDVLEILRERYARGEIETEEFQLRRDELKK